MERDVHGHECPVILRGSTSILRLCMSRPITEETEVTMTVTVEDERVSRTMVFSVVMCENLNQSHGNLSISSSKFFLLLQNKIM